MMTRAERPFKRGPSFFAGGRIGFSNRAHFRLVSYRREHASAHWNRKGMYQREGRVSLFAAPSESGFLAPPLGPTSAWFPIGPQATSTTFFAPFTSGRVTALVVNPSNANNVY